MMDIRSNTEQIADHYARYVGELHEFFKCSGVLFGSPEHLAGMTKRLRENEVFREELYSMTRSIIFREGGALPPTELLRLLTVAVGGAAVDDQAEQHRPEIRYLLHFLTSVTRAPVNQPRSEDSRPAPAPGARNAAPATSGPAVRPAAARWSGKPSARALKWSDVWNASALAGVRRLFEGGPRWWWVPASGAALASVSLLLWLPHTRVPPPTVHESIAPVVAANPPQAVPLPVSPEPGAEEELAPSPAPTPAAADSLSSSVEASARVRKRLDTRSRSRREPAAASIRKAGTPPKAKERPAAHPVLSAQVTPAKHAGIPGRAQPEPRSPLPPSLAADESDPGLRRGERSSNYAIPSSSSHRGTLDVSSGVMSANLISAPAPEYPKLASAIHLQGAVILQAVIGKNGEVTATHVLRGHFLLREAAVHAVRQWRYRPFLADGHPVDVATVVTVDFRRQR